MHKISISCAYRYRLPTHISECFAKPIKTGKLMRGSPPAVKCHRFRNKIENDRNSSHFFFISFFCCAMMYLCRDREQRSSTYSSDEKTEEIKSHCEPALFK